MVPAPLQEILFSYQIAASLPWHCFYDDAGCHWWEIVQDQRVWPSFWDGKSPFSFLQELLTDSFLMKTAEVNNWLEWSEHILRVKSIDCQLFDDVLEQAYEEMKKKNEKEQEKSPLPLAEPSELSWADSVYYSLYIHSIEWKWEWSDSSSSSWRSFWSSFLSLQLNLFLFVLLFCWKQTKKSFWESTKINPTKNNIIWKVAMEYKKCNWLYYRNRGKDKEAITLDGSL